MRGVSNSTHKKIWADDFKTEPAGEAEIINQPDRTGVFKACKSAKPLAHFIQPTFGERCAKLYS